MGDTTVLHYSNTSDMLWEPHDLTKYLTVIMLLQLSQISTNNYHEDKTTKVAGSIYVFADINSLRPSDAYMLQ